MTQIKIKTCGVTNAHDARACAELGVDMIGFNFYSKSPRYIEPIAARQIIEQMPEGLCAVGIFVDSNAQEIRNTARLARIACVQLHGDFVPETCSELARKFRVIRAITTDTQFHPENAAAFSDCDVLVDTHHPQLRGGTGQTCDWSAARATLPFARFLILSGGLNPQNVGQAIAAVAPHGVDVCSGVESSPGVKNHRALKEFVAAVRAAERSTVASRF